MRFMSLKLAYQKTIKRAQPPDSERMWGDAFIFKSIRMEDTDSQSDFERNLKEKINFLG